MTACIKATRVYLSKVWPAVWESNIETDVYIENISEYGLCSEHISLDRGYGIIRYPWSVEFEVFDRLLIHGYYVMVDMEIVDPPGQCRFIGKIIETRDEVWSTVKMDNKEIPSGRQTWIAEDYDIWKKGKK